MKATVLALAVVAVSGCSSIVSDNKYSVRVKSEPIGANFEVINSDNRVIDSGVTPATVRLKSSEGYFNGAEYRVVYEKDGYQSNDTVIDSSLDGWYWGNILIGGGLGFFVIDPLTGAMWELPDSATSKLSKIED